MNVDINFVRGVLTLLLLISFTGLCIWAYSKKRVSAFNEAANLPFADEAINQNTTAAMQKNSNGEPS